MPRPGESPRTNAPSSTCRSTVTPTGGCRSCSSLAMWLGTEVAACSSPTGRVADRADRQVVGVRQRGDPQEVGDAPDRGRLDDVDRAGRQQRTELLQPGQVLAGGDRGADRRARRRPGLRRPSAGPAPRPRSGPGCARVRRRGGPPACGVQDSFASSIRPGRDPPRGLGQHVAHQGQPVPVPLDVEAALELGRPQPALGVGLVDGDQLVVGRGRCRGRRRTRGPAGRVRPAAATAARRRPAP